MTRDSSDTSRSLEADLVAWDKVIIIETKGRHSGRQRRAAVGFVETAGGALLVAANDDATHWGQNLMADPNCRVQRRGVFTASSAVLLGDQERRAVVTDLILKYGTPAEQQGSGPAFRLEAVERTPRA